MPTTRVIWPQELESTVQELLAERAGEWVSPRWLWEQIREVAPDLASRVEKQVSQYQDPERNNAVWFVSNTLYHVRKHPGFTLSDIKQVPSMRSESLWLVARADARPPGPASTACPSE